MVVSSLRLGTDLERRKNDELNLHVDFEMSMGSLGGAVQQVWVGDVNVGSPAMGVGDNEP